MKVAHDARVVNEVWARVAPLAIALAALLVHAASAASAIEGAIVRVIDGDTVWLQRDAGSGKPVKVRLAGIDAPQRCQAGGAAARDALAARVLNRRVLAHTRAIDDYRRTVATPRLNGEDIGAWMVQQGHAWTHGCRHAPGPYARLEAEARAAHRGVFADPQAQEPSQFRKQHGRCI